MEPSEWAALAQGADKGIALLLEQHEDRRQLRQQGKLQQLQIQGQKEMSQFNKALGLEMWKDTNYSEQVKQLQQAGLNPGLLYGMGGSGGASTNVTGGNVTGAQAGNQLQDIGMGMDFIQMSQTAAQTELIKAQTEKTQVETNNIRNEPGNEGIDTGVKKQNIKESQQNILESAARIEDIKQGIKNKQVEEAMNVWKGKTAQIESRIMEGTEKEQILKIKGEADKVVGEANQAYLQGHLMEEEYETLRAKLKNEVLMQQIEMLNKRSERIKMSAETQLMVRQRMASFEQLNYQEREVKVKELLADLQKQETDFRTATPNEIKQWTSLLLDIVTLGGAIGGGSKGTSPGFKY